MQFKSFMESLTTEEKTIEVTMKSGHKFTAPIKVTHKDWHIVKHPVSGKQYRVDHKGNTLSEETLDESHVEFRIDHREKVKGDHKPTFADHEAKVSDTTDKATYVKVPASKANSFKSAMKTKHGVAVELAEEVELDEADVQARADYKLDKNGRKYHKQIAFRDGSNDEANEKNEVREETEMNEEMTDAQKTERERIVKGMKKNIAGFKAKYGERAKEVMYATATKQAMKEESELEEQAPVAPSLVKHRIGVTVSDPNATSVTARKEKVQKFVHVTHSDNKEGAQKVGEKHFKKKGYVVHDSWHAGMVNEEVDQIDERNKENATRRKMMDASRGARWKVQNKVSADDVRDWDGKHKTAQAQNKAIGRALRSEEATLDEAQYGVNLGSRPVSGQKEYQGKEIKSFHPNKEKEAREFADKHGYVVKKNMLPAGNSITHTWDIHKEEVELDESIKLGSKVKVHAPGKDYHGEVGYVGEIRHGAYKGAPKTYTVDYGDRKSVQLDKKNVKLHKEEAEQIDELQKSTLASYAKKANASQKAAGDKMDSHHRLYGDGNSKEFDKAQATHHKRAMGLGKLSKRGVNPFQEEVEQISETPVTKAKQPYRPGSIDPATGKTREAPRGTMAYDKAQREKKLKEELEQEAAEVSEGYRGNSEADKPFFDAQDHKKAAEKARKSGDHFSYHKHMSAHHDAMEHWSNNKGRTHVANQHAMKADEHEDYAQQARLKKEQFSIDEEGNLMSEKLTYAQFMEQLYVTIEEAKDDYWDFKDLKDEPKSTTRKVSGTRYGGSAQKDDPEDDEHAKKSSEPAVKRGRGRPAGSKSGANQKVTSGKSYGGIATHSLHLPNSNR